MAQLDTGTHLQPLTDTPTATHRHTYSHSPTHLQPLTDTPIDPHAHPSTKRTPHV